MERYNNVEPYNPSAGPWPLDYSEEEKQAQREAGKQIVQELKDAEAQGHHEFHIPEGIYRIEEPLHLEGYEGMDIYAHQVEIIAEGDAKPEHFRSDTQPGLFQFCRGLGKTIHLAIAGDDWRL